MTRFLCCEMTREPFGRHGFKLVHRLTDSEEKAEGQVYMELKTPGKKKK